MRLLLQRTMSTPPCHRVDPGTGPFAEHQQATWKHGYWLRDMNQKCYEGVHLHLWVPIGVVSVMLLCVLPPLASFLVLWRHRTTLDMPATITKYGFLYARYRCVSPSQQHRSHPGRT